jgi:hypothetical protein
VGKRADALRFPLKVLFFLSAGAPLMAAFAQTAAPDQAGPTRADLLAGTEVKFSAGSPYLSLASLPPQLKKGSFVYVTDASGTSVVAKTVVTSTKARSVGKGVLVILLPLQPKDKPLSFLGKGMHRAWDAEGLKARPSLPALSPGITWEAPFAEAEESAPQPLRSLPLTKAGKTLSVVVPPGQSGFELGDVVYIGEQRPDGHFVAARAVVSANAKSVKGPPLQRASLLVLEPKNFEASLVALKAPLVWTREDAKASPRKWLLSESIPRDGDVARELGEGSGSEDTIFPTGLANATVSVDGVWRGGVLLGLPVFLGVNLAPRVSNYGASLSLFPPPKDPVAWMNSFGVGMSYERAVPVTFEATRGIDGVVSAYSSRHEEMAAWIYVRPHFGKRWLNRVSLDVKVWKRGSTTIERKDASDTFTVTSGSPEARLGLEFSPFSHALVVLGWEAPLPQKIKATQKTSSSAEGEIESSTEGTMTQSAFLLAVGLRYPLGNILPTAAFEFSSGLALSSAQMRLGGKLQETKTLVHPRFTFGVSFVQ